MLNYRSFSSHRHNISNYRGKAIFASAGSAFLLFVLTLLLCLTPGAARAQISQLSDDTLRGISGQAGVSIMMDGSAQIHYDLIKFSDTQSTPNWIELHDFNVDNGAGGAFSFATRYYDAPVALVTNFVTYYTVTAPNPTKAAYTWAANEFDILTDAKVQAGTIAGLEDGMKRVLYPITYDIATDSGGRTFVQILDSSAINPRTYSVGSLVIAGQPLGSIKLESLSQGPSLLRYWAHAGQGISFDYATAISAGALTYTYNSTLSKSLSLSGINIAGSATGAPETPSHWAFSGDFKIGTIGDTCTSCNQPATIDVATDSSNNTSLFLNLPMSGTVRVADVNFGGQGFGPIAIDGIQVHSLNVKITP